MDSSALVERITQEVLEVYRQRGGRPAAARQTFSYGDYPLIGVCGNPLGRQQAVDAFGAIRRSCSRLKVLLSPQAAAQFSDSKRVFGGFTIDPSARDHADAMGRFSELIVLNTSVNFVAKLALLLADTPLTVATFELLAAGKPVVLCTGPLEPYLANGAIRAKVEGYLATLESYGIALAKGHAPLESPGAPVPSVAKPALISISAGPPPGLKKSDCTGCPSVGHCVTHCDTRVQEFVSTGVARIGATAGANSIGPKMAGMIDHTLLKPDATDDEVRKLCEEARTHVFASVCVNPSKVKLSAELLRGSPVMVCTVVGFPLGATTSVAKAMETRDAVANGADEIDMVINVGALKSKDYATVKADIAAVVAAAGGKTVKVILETSLLNDDEKVQACRLSKEAGADFVKTSTGFAGGGATVADIALMRKTVGPEMGVKASGGIRDFDTARKMVEAGATRIGASASVSIVKNPEAVASGKGY